MTKTHLKTATALFMICAILCTLVACNADTTLKGTYTNKDGFIEQSFTFKDGNKVEVSAFGLNLKGDYEIKDGEITITYKAFGLSYDWVKSFKKEGNSIFIDGTEFVKEK